MKKTDDKKEELFGFFDWNKLSLDEMVEYLRTKFKFSSSGDSKCINSLIDFYDKHKTCEDTNPGDSSLYY